MQERRQCWYEHKIHMNSYNYTRKHQALKVKETFRQMKLRKIQDEELKNNFKMLHLLNEMTEYFDTVLYF